MPLSRLSSSGSVAVVASVTATSCDPEKAAAYTEIIIVGDVFIATGSSIVSATLIPLSSSPDELHADMNQAGASMAKYSVFNSFFFIVGV